MLLRVLAATLIRGAQNCQCSVGLPQLRDDTRSPIVPNPTRVGDRVSEANDQSVELFKRQFDQPRLRHLNRNQFVHGFSPFVRRATSLRCRALSFWLCRNRGERENEKWNCGLGGGFGRNAVA